MALGPYLCLSKVTYLTSLHLLLTTAPRPREKQPSPQPLGTDEDPCAKQTSSPQAECSFGSVMGICSAEQPQPRA